ESIQGVCYTFEKKIVSHGVLDECVFQWMNQRLELASKSKNSSSSALIKSTPQGPLDDDGPSLQREQAQEQDQDCLYICLNALLKQKLEHFLDAKSNLDDVVQFHEILGKYPNVQMYMMPMAMEQFETFYRSLLLEKPE